MTDAQSFSGRLTCFATRSGRLLAGVLLHYNREDDGNV